MRRISAMYQISGGTSWQHTCAECRECKKRQVGKKRVVRKCRKYHSISGTDPDWNARSTACRFFRCTEEEQTEPKKESDADYEGGRQMTIEDFPELMP